MVTEERATEVVKVRLMGGGGSSAKLEIKNRQCMKSEL